jgi:hypothetical protein
VIAPGPYWYNDTGGAEPQAVDVIDDGGALTIVFPDEGEGPTSVAVDEASGELEPRC